AAKRMLSPALVAAAQAHRYARAAADQHTVPERVLAIAAGAGVFHQQFQVGLYLDGFGPAVDVEPDRLVKVHHFGRKPDGKLPATATEEDAVVFQNLAVEVHGPGAARERPLGGIDV